MLRDISAAASSPMPKPVNTACESARKPLISFRLRCAAFEKLSTQPSVFSVCEPKTVSNLLWVSSASAAALIAALEKFLIASTPILTAAPMDMAVTIRLKASAIFVPAPSPSSPIFFSFVPAFSAFSPVFSVERPAFSRAAVNRVSIV